MYLVVPSVEPIVNDITDVAWRFLWTLKMRLDPAPNDPVKVIAIAIAIVFWSNG